MVNWRAVALAIALLAVLLSAAYYYKVSERASVKEMKIIWPSESEVEGRRCSINSTYHFLESALLSCRGDECYSLVRYLIYFPTDDEFEEEIPLEIWSNGQIILKTNVTAFKRNYTLFIQTVALIVKLPKGAEVRIMNLSLNPLECLHSEPDPPQVIYMKGAIDDWITLGNGARVRRIFDDLYFATWRGNASLICGNKKLYFKDMNPYAGDIALVSLEGRCELELNGVKSAVGS